MAEIDWTLTWNTVLAISTAIMAGAIITTAIYAVCQLKDIKKSRHSALMMQLIQAWDSKETLLARQKINEHYQGSTPEEKLKNLTEHIISLDKGYSIEFYEIVRVANYFENLGYLVCEGHLDRKHALNLFAGAAENYWRFLAGFADYLRMERDPSQSDAWVYFEYLAKGCPNKNRCLGIIKRPILKMHKQNNKDAS